MQVFLNNSKTYIHNHRSFTIRMKKLANYHPLSLGLDNPLKLKHYMPNKQLDADLYDLYNDEMAALWKKIYIFSAQNNEYHQGAHA